MWLQILVFNRDDGLPQRRVEDNFAWEDNDGDYNNFYNNFTSC
jgi:hypothetical protein